MTSAAKAELSRTDYVSRVSQAIQLGLLPQEALYGFSYSKQGPKWSALLRFSVKDVPYIFSDIGNTQGIAKWQICEKICRHFRIGDLTKKNAARNKLFEVGYKIRIEDLDWGIDGVTATMQLYDHATGHVVFRKKMAAVNLHAFGEAVKCTAWEYATSPNGEHRLDSLLSIVDVK